MKCQSERISLIPIELDKHQTRTNIKELSYELATTIKEDIDIANLAIIMRAGLGMLEGFEAIYPESDVGFIGIKSPKELGRAATLYLRSIPVTTSDRPTILLEPVVAEAKASLLASKVIRNAGGKPIVASLISTGLGARNLAESGIEHYTLATYDIDEEGIIIPNVGDVGDRLWGNHGE